VRHGAFALRQKPEPYAAYEVLNHPPLAKRFRRLEMERSGNPSSKTQVSLHTAHPTEIIQYDEMLWPNGMQELARGEAADA
jgi:hypothetical protein